MAMPNEVVTNSSTEEILDAQAHVWNQILNFVNSMSLKVAIQLAIPDVIHKHGKAMTLSQLVDAIPINKAKSNDLHHLMRILTHSKIFDKVMIISKNEEEEEEEEEEAYCLTLASRLLLRDERLSLAHLALVTLDPLLMDPWHCTSEWFRNEDSTAFVTKHGKTFWEYAGVDQRLNELFNKSMAGDAGLVTTILANNCRHVFEGLRSMVDVGGGNGATAKGFADAFPGLKCTVLDLPQVVAGLEGSHDLTFVGGDMFHFIPHADALFFKGVFHDWSDENCVKILEKCKEALTWNKDNNGGKVIIVDIVVEDKKEDHKGTETQLCLDVQMINLLRGKERTEKEWAKLFFDAGFANYKMSPVLGLRSVIEVFP
nr:flavonoid O-methyltransferase 5 [Scutellaria baicalensis]